MIETYDLVYLIQENGDLGYQEACRGGCSRVLPRAAKRER